MQRICESNDPPQSAEGNGAVFRTAVNFYSMKFQWKKIKSIYLFIFTVHYKELYLVWLYD